ncbi:MAG TPA: sulfite exporter TauE/SafE family protein [Candidatus Limnocylindrales bacterium]|jgi:sulfite exporter TauE/SafE|nr:sulfite exporter TauE/SafE family protein [Candidatus Limnocylindrales bacterium]
MDYFTAFFLGLVGSVHCAGMCGPLALALPSTGTTTCGFVVGRSAYNCGRLLSYSALGLVFGLAGRTLSLAGIQGWVSIGLGVALLAGLLGSRKLGFSRPVTETVNLLKSQMAGLLRRRSLIAPGLLGMLNGLLPCGLVYVACAGATATGGVLAGIGYMAAFGAGTTPLMLAIGLSGKAIPWSVRLQLRKAIPVSVFLLASLLILRGMSLGIPYLSPDLSGGGATCCHK